MWNLKDLAYPAFGHPGFYFLSCGCSWALSSPIFANIMSDPFFLHFFPLIINEKGILRQIEIINVEKIGELVTGWM